MKPTIDAMREQLNDINRKLDNTVQNDTLRMLGLDPTQSEQHRKDLEWLRKQRTRSDSWRPVFWNTIKAVLAAAAIAVCAYLWQSTVNQVRQDISHYEQSK